MSDILEYLFGAASFVPHGYCMLWRPDLVAIHAVSDAVIALSYFSIPLAIYIFMRRRKVLDHRSFFVMFAVFILACGTTHLVGLITLWEPIYGFQALSKAGTAVISAMTAVAIWPAIPAALALPSARELAAVNARLEAEIETRRRTNAELERLSAELDDRVRARTQALDLANRQLTLANEGLAQFAYVASHDLQEPMRKIAVYSDVLRREVGAETDSGSETAYALDVLSRSAIRARRLVADLLGYARAQNSALSRRPAAVAAMAGDALTVFEGAIAERKAVIVQRIEPAFVDTDPVLFAQIAENAISNALKFSRDGEVPRLEIDGVRQGDGSYELTFTDHGVGFDPALAEKIFEPFRRLQAQHEVEGSGIGLSIVRAAAVRLGWSVAAEGRPGEGAVLRLVIPARDVRSPGPDGEPSAA